MAKLNESELDKRLAKVLGEIFGGTVSVRKAKTVQDAYQKLIADALANGDDVLLHGFGGFKLENVPAKSGEAFGYAYDNPAYSRVEFRPYAALRAAASRSLESGVIAGSTPEED